MAKTVALVAASDFNSQHFSATEKEGVFDAIVAVDGGYAHLKSAGAAPSVAIGDFDSLGYIPEDIECLTFPTHKNKSDLELALDYVVELGASTIYIYGALGGRLDHTLANIQLLARYAESGMNVIVIDSAMVVQYVVGPDTLKLPCLEQGTISVFSLTPKSMGVTECGLEYPLENTVLTDRTTLGLSNEFIGKEASISLEKGTLIVMMHVL